MAKYLKKYNTQAEYDAALASGLTLPNVSVVVENRNTYYNPYVVPETPVISGEETFTGTTQVTITCSTTGASIYYTLDGSTPTTNSTAYTGTVTLSATTTVKAIAAKDGVTTNVTSKVFEKDNPVPSGFVDLGLSVYWANSNIGANSPEGYGAYFDWGNVTPHEPVVNTEDSYITWQYSGGYNDSCYCLSSPTQLSNITPDYIRNNYHNYMSANILDLFYSDLDRYNYLVIEHCNEEYEYSLSDDVSIIHYNDGVITFEYPQGDDAPRFIDHPSMTKFDYSFDEDSYSGTTGASLTGDIPVNATYDAAYAFLGGSSRMPTSAETTELYDTDKCDWTWTTLNGVNGYRVTSKVSGFEGNSIFLPAAGVGGDGSLDDTGYGGYYWTSSDGGDGYNAYSLDFGGGRYVFPTAQGAYTHGNSVRAVQDKV